MVSVLDSVTNSINFIAIKLLLWGKNGWNSIYKRYKFVIMHIINVHRDKPETFWESLFLCCHINKLPQKLRKWQWTNRSTLKAAATTDVSCWEKKQNPHCYKPQRFRVSFSLKHSFAFPALPRQLINIGRDLERNARFISFLPLSTACFPSLLGSAWQSTHTSSRSLHEWLTPWAWSSPFHRRQNWGSMKLMDFSKVTQLSGGPHVCLTRKTTGDPWSPYAVPSHLQLQSSVVKTRSLLSISSAPGRIPCLPFLNLCIYLWFQIFI